MERPELNTPEYNELKCQLLDAARLIRDFCMAGSCDTCPFARDTNQGDIQMCRLTDDSSIPAGWPVGHGKPEEN